MVNARARVTVRVRVMVMLGLRLFDKRGSWKTSIVQKCHLNLFHIAQGFYYIMQMFYRM